MAGKDRPIRTLTALIKLCKSNNISHVEIGDIKLSFGTEAAPGLQGRDTVQAQPPIKPDLPIKEQPLSDADLVLDPPAGMLVPVTEQDSN